MVPSLGASPWWHQRMWFPDLVVCPGGFAYGPSTMWRSEVAVLAVRRCSHLVVAWSRRVCRGLLPLVPDSVGFCGSRVCARPRLVVVALRCSLPLLKFLLLWPVRD
ncbi:hypothetical protein Taro_050331 [Colocasia esculenta]|uniref:Uncharacterized protein n=1 Tax=Colocasia esculenta TaxID=4460 RepID=A0A843XD62_COLES|nr:hypothetical protein [Colocasia esculenta]